MLEFWQTDAHFICFKQLRNGFFCAGIVSKWELYIPGDSVVKASFKRLVRNPKFFQSLKKLKANVDNVIVMGCRSEVTCAEEEYFALAEPKISLILHLKSTNAPQPQVIEACSNLNEMIKVEKEKLQKAPQEYNLLTQLKNKETEEKILKNTNLSAKSRVRVEYFEKSGVKRITYIHYKIEDDYLHYGAAIWYDCGKEHCVEGQVEEKVYLLSDTALNRFNVLPKIIYIRQKISFMTDFVFKMVKKHGVRGYGKTITFSDDYYR
jgi:hypothetical protein